MKYSIIIFLGLLVTSCGMKQAFTNNLKEEFNLEPESQMKKVQFYISQTITLQRVKQTGTQGTTESGVLVTNKSKVEDRIIIQAHTPGVFEGYGKNNEMLIRFEAGQGRYLTFNVRQDNSGNAKFYLVAEWDMNRGGQITYNNEKYVLDSYANNAYLLVVLKKLQRTKRTDRVVKGMKV